MSVHATVQVKCRVRVRDRVSFWLRVVGTVSARVRVSSL